MVDVDGSEAVGGDQRAQAGRSEVSAVAGEVQVIPVLSGPAGLKRTQVRHSDQHHAARAHPAGQAGHGRAGVFEMLEDVPGRDRVQGAFGHAGVLDPHLTQLDPHGPGRGDAPVTGLDAVRPPAGRPGRGHEAAPARPHVEQPERGLGWLGRRPVAQGPANEAQPLAVESAQERKGQARQSGRDRCVGARLVELSQVGGGPVERQRHSTSRSSRPGSAGAAVIQRSSPPPQAGQTVGSASGFEPGSRTRASSRTEGNLDRRA